MTESMEHSKGFRHIRVDSLNNNEEKSAEEVKWEEKLDSTWQARLHGMDPLEPMLAREKLEALIEEASDHYIRKIRDEKYEWKYGCGIQGCAKLFRAPEFLRKHLLGKHPEKFEDIISKAHDEIYFQNYMNGYAVYCIDPHAPGAPETSQQPVRRQGSHAQGRITQCYGVFVNKKRGGHAGDFDRFERANERNTNYRTDRVHKEDLYDRNGHLKSQDYPTVPVVSQDGILDHSDPPSFLIPLSNATPCEPFLPGPPQVAMRMMEQGASLSMMVPPAPLPYQDYCQVCSYNDLDALEDEVTPIDY